MGLLDMVNDDGFRLGLGLLAAGGARSDGASTGQRLAEGLGSLDAFKANQQKQKFMQMQMDNYASEIEARKLAAIKDARMQDMIGKMMGDGGAQGPAPSSGAYSPSADGMGPVLPQNAQGSGGIMGLAKQLNLPPEVIQSDMVFNGGKKISEMLASRSEPKWQNINGNLVNTNAPGFTGGLQAGINASANGQVTAWQPDGKGGIVVGAPAGAIDTALAYESGKQVPVDLPNGQKATFTPREWADYTGKGIIPQRFGGSPAIPITGSWNPSPQDMARIQADIQATGNPNPTISGIGSGQRPSGNIFGLTQDPAAKDAQDLQQARALETIRTGAKAGADRIMSGYDNARSALDTITSIGESRKAIQGGSFVGAGADTRLNISKGLNALGFNISPDQVSNTDYLNSQLGQGILNKAKTLGANPTDNDARIIRDIVGSIGKDPQALNRLLDFQETIANRAIAQHNKNYSDAKSRGFDAGFDLTVEPPKSAPAQNLMSTLPTANASNKGRKIRDTETGKILVSNGLTWAEEK